MIHAISDMVHYSVTDKGILITRGNTVLLFKTFDEVENLFPLISDSLKKELKEAFFKIDMDAVINE